MTAVTAKILDPNGKPYAGAQVNVSFVPSPTATTVPLINGSVFNTTVPIVQADSFGNFTTNLVDNTLVSDGHTGPVASMWAFFIQSASVCFPGNTVEFEVTLTISGVSQDISASLQAAAATLPSCGGGATVIASGTAVLGTSSIASGTAATVVSVAATGVTTADNIQADFNSDPTSTVGYSPGANGILTIVKYPTSGHVNFKVCNNTGGSITPGPVTLNWRVVR